MRLEARSLIKRSNITGEVPTIGPSTDHTDGTWSNTDIYDGELFLNAIDNILWIGSGTTIKRLTGFEELVVFAQANIFQSITHNLGTNRYIVQVIDDANNATLTSAFVARDYAAEDMEMSVSVAGTYRVLILPI